MALLAQVDKSPRARPKPVLTASLGATPLQDPLRASCALRVSLAVQVLPFVPLVAPVRLPLQPDPPPVVHALQAPSNRELVEPSAYAVKWALAHLLVPTAARSASPGDSALPVEVSVRAAPLAPSAQQSRRQRAPSATQAPLQAARDPRCVPTALEGLFLA